MEFCEYCDNMLYMRTNDNGDLVKYCKQCTHETVQSAKTGTAIRVTHTLYTEDELLYKQHQNMYLRFDPTLPRVNDIPCPNAECEKSKQNPSVLYVKYHPVDMKYFYMCDHCGKTWRPEETA